MTKATEWNRHQLAARQRAYYQRNREKVAAGKRAYRQRNREPVLCARCDRPFFRRRGRPAAVPTCEECKAAARRHVSGTLT